MKRGLILGVVFGLFLISFVSACSDDQRIMRLYQPTNSHATVYDDTSYSIEICSPNGEIVDHTQGQFALWLSGSTNSHVSLTQSITYNTPVYFGNELICARRDNECVSGETPVLSLYQADNSHVAEGDFLGYDIKICCIRGTGVTGATWKDMSGAPIAQANLNDMVILSVNGTQLQGQIIDYEIMKKQGGDWFDWLIPDSSVATLPSSDFTTWRANTAGEFYFKASSGGTTINSKDNEETYGVLTVSENEENNPPVANIIDTKDRGVYFSGIDLLFNQNSFDEDDEFTYKWDLGDGRTFTGDSVTRNKWTFTDSFTDKGQKDIVLTVTDSRGAISRDQISILILDSSLNDAGVLSYINSPTWGWTTGNVIDFDGSGSYAVEYVDGAVNCLSGNCPLTTGNCPTGSIVDCINLSIIPPEISGYGGLNFDWTVKNGFTGKETNKNSGDVPNTKITLDTPSIPTKPHQGKLKVTYTYP